MTMKKRVPPRAHNKPNVAAICIHNFFFSGFRSVITPETSKGAPSMLGKNEVIELDSDKTETAMPQAIRKAP